MDEEVYDPLSQTQKHIMLKNGAFEFDSFKRVTCCCGHFISFHLDYIDCCFLSKELCLCDTFLDKESKLIIPQEDGKLPHKQKEQIEDRQLDRQLDNYIQTLAKM